DPLGRLVEAAYSTGECFQYDHDAIGNRTTMTSTMSLSGTVVTSYTYDAANRLATRAVSDGRAYTYTWSARGQLLAEWTQGYPVRTFTYDGAGHLVEATVFTLTTRFTYAGLGGRVIVEVVGQGATTYTLDYAGGNRILGEETVTGTVSYLYGLDCLGERRDGTWLYYLPDGDGLVRQGTDWGGYVVSRWLFDPDGVVLEGPEGLVSHLVCGGVYDWSTGLIYRDGKYFDPMLGIWLAVLPLAVIQSRRRRRKGQGLPWCAILLLVGVSVVVLAGCAPPEPAPQQPACTETLMPSTVVTPTIPQSPLDTPESPTDTPAAGEDDAIAVARAVGSELDRHGLIPEGQQWSVATTDGRAVQIVSYIWGDNGNRDPVFAALAWVIMNRVDAGVALFPDCSTPGSCARSLDFQAQYSSSYMPTPHDETLARSVVNRQRPDEVGGAVFFHDLSQPPGSGYLAKMTNLDRIDPNVHAALGNIAEQGFYFYSLEQWRSGW
ncbi:MAG: hypothetical protein JXC32_13285, partial [Anaerolineae bacterium]|nr:hypothetical protein [Anaerolineae bacterium]